MVEETKLLRGSRGRGGAWDRRSACMHVPAQVRCVYARVCVPCPRAGMCRGVCNVEANSLAFGT